MTGCRAQANKFYIKPDNVKSALLYAQSALRRWTELYAKLQNECGEATSRKLDYNLPPADHLRALEAIEAALSTPSERTATFAPHTLASENDTKLLRAFTPAKTMAPGYELEYWNLTMVRMKGDVVLTVRLPSEFSHYVQTEGGRMAAWHPGAVSSVRFTRELWNSFVAQIADADKVFQAADQLDAL